MNRLLIVALVVVPLLVAALPLASVFMFQDGGGSSGQVFVAQQPVLTLPATPGAFPVMDVPPTDDHVAYGLSDADSGCGLTSSSPVEG